LKIGGWGHLGQLPTSSSQHGMPLANPASNGIPLMHRGTTEYGVIDQQL
jgi:hypothetical protein